jgi:periplasmic protein TonB
MPFPKLNILDATKIPSLIILAVILNIAIFILIQQLVSKEHALDLNLADINLVQFIRLDQKPEPPKPKDEIEELEPPPPEQEPPPPEMSEPQIESAQPMQMVLTLPSINLPLSLSGTPYLGDAMKSRLKGKPARKPARFKIDTSVVPTLRVPPIYPLRALRSGIQGVVTVEFTIAIDGSVKDAVVVKSKPPKIFDSAVLKAISKWKYNPDIVNGNPIEKRARQDVKFKLKR